MAPAKLGVAVVGARRVRQGIGEFVARGFQKAGADVRAVCASSPATAAAAARTLRESHGIEAAPFDSVERMLREAPVDVVAICSPVELHAEHLEIASRFPVDVLCEKPLWWTPDGDVRERTRRLLDRFAGKRLRLNTQWPYTLDAFRRLHGARSTDGVRRFSMLLSPVSEGDAMLVDSGSHLISMLQALLGRHEARGVRWDGTGKVSFAYGGADVEFTMRRCLERPRPAWYAIDGLRAERRIRLPDYSIEFTDGARTVASADPLDLLIEDFIDARGRGAATPADDILEGMVLLRSLYDSLPR